MAESKKNYTNILLILVLLVVGFSIYTSMNIQTDVEGYNKKIEKLQKGIDSVMTLNKELDDNITSLKLEIKNVDSIIGTVEHNVNKIKRNTDEQISNVDTFTFSDLEQFFTDRYNSQVGTTDSETSN
jgi:archaellum component FlaC